jgi:hypothetical protein
MPKFNRIPIGYIVDPPSIHFFQMTEDVDAASAAAALEEEEAYFMACLNVGQSPSLSLIDKFNFVKKWPSVQPLGLCGLVPDVPYEISSLGRYGNCNVCVHWMEPRPNLFLPYCYARMVSRRDIAVVNSGVRHFALTKTR